MPSRARRRWPWWITPLALLALPLLVFAPLVFGGQTLFLHDIQYYFYPYHALAADLIKGGTPPLWNPYAFSGLPLLGDGQTAMLYPPNWLF